MAKFRGPAAGPVIIGDVIGPPPVRTLPPWVTIGGTTTPDVVALDRVSVSVSERSLTVAKVGADIPIVYGRDMVGAKIYRAKVSGGKLVVVCVWCEGEIQAVESIVIDGKLFTGTAKHYTGAAGQTGDSLVASVWGQADVLAGIGYSVLSLPAETGLQISGIMQGRKVYDPRSTLTVYSTNPALCLADFITTQSDFSVNWASVGTAADYCDEIITGSTKRWEIGLTVTRKNINDWIAALKEYANVFLYNMDGEVHFVPDEPRAVDHTLIGSDIKNMRLRKFGQRDAPTQVFSRYTLQSGTEWDEPEVFTPDPVSGDPLRVTRLRLPGLFRAVHAKRKAVEVLNRANLEDLEATFELLDNGVKVTKGDVLSITHPLGLTAKSFRVHEIDPARRGRWRVVAREYNAIYSSEIVSDPQAPDTGLASPFDVPVVTGLALSVNEPQFQTGIYFSSIKATWSELVDYPFQRSFEAVFRQAGTIVGSVPTTDLEAVFGPVAEGLTYDVEVRPLGMFGNTSTGTTTASIAVTGKDFPPTDVPGFVAVEIGGELRLRWDAAADNKAIWRYELRYGAPGVTWAAAIPMTKVDALMHNTSTVPVGTWDILIKAIDNAFNESSNATVVSSVVVTSDANAFILDSTDAGHATDVSMTLLNTGDYVVDSGESWDALYPLAMGTYVNPLYSYQTPGAAQYVSAELDPAAGDVSGVWQAVPVMQILSGSPTKELELFDGTAWSAKGLVTVVDTAQKARFKLSGTGAVFIVTPPTPIRLDVVVRGEDGSEKTIGGGEATSSNAGTQLSDTAATFVTDGVAVGDVVQNLTDGSTAIVTSITSENIIVHGALAGGTGNTWAVGDIYAIGVKITTSGSFSKVKKITLTPNNPSGPVAFTPDDITMGSPAYFFVYGYDFTGEEVAEPFLWAFEGV